MKLNLLTVTSLLCGLFLLGSCAKDEPQGNTKKEQSVAGGPLVSIDLDMDVAVAEFNEPEAKAQEGRAFTSPQTPVTVKEGKNKELDDNLEPIAGKQQKILSLLREKFIENNQTIDVVMHFECGTKKANVVTKMSYDNSIGRYRHGLVGNRNINVPQEILDEMGTTKNAKVTIYTGGSSYDAGSERFTVDPVMKEVSLSSLASTPVNIPVLYVSTGTELKVENNKLVSASTELAKLKPQGSLLLVTFRNNMDQDVTFDGVTAVSNNYFGPNDQSKKTFLKVKGQYNPATDLTTEAPKYISPYNTAVDGGKAYTYFAKDFSLAQSTVAKGGAIADKAFIFWGIKGDATKVAPTSANGLGDNGYLLNPATGLIHVYAQNAQIGGKAIDHPNYSVAPIGGAHFSPESGKAYTLNCEFYTQPRQALGYLDKGYLYKDDGTWKHHDVNAGGLTNDPKHYNSPTLRNVPLVSSAEAREVLDGNVTTSKGKMYVPNQAWLNLMSLLYPIEFSEASGVSRFKDFKDHFAKGASGYDYRAYIYKELLPYKSVNDDTSEFSEGQFICADYARKDQGAANEAVGYAYRHLYIAPRKATGAQPRSKYQTLVRCLTRSKVVDSSPYVTSIVMESVYLGKYFVGTLVTTPLYVERNATKPFTYLQESSLFGRDAEPTRGMVTRILINANEVRGVFKYDKYLKPYSEVKTFDTVDGIKLLHWGTVPGQWEYEAMQIGNNKTRLKQLIEEVNKVSRAPILNRFYGYNSFKGGIYYSRNGGRADDDVRGLFSDNTYQPMRAYSTTYQGDDGRKPQQGL
ncbi:MAG: hypothetical protein HXN04_01285 [Porphyromonadaceae bacterium]|nr:hypothetical protein [Porphyromonadaceae bacterium]